MNRLDRYLVVYGPLTLLVCIAFAVAWGAFTLDSQREELEYQRKESTQLRAERQMAEVLSRVLTYTLGIYGSELEDKIAELNELRSQAVVSTIQLHATRAQQAAVRTELEMKREELDAAKRLIDKHAKLSRELMIYSNLNKDEEIQAIAIWQVGLGDGPEASLKCSDDTEQAEQLRKDALIVTSNLQPEEANKILPALRGLCAHVSPFYLARLIREIAISRALTGNIFRRYADWCPRHANATFETQSVAGEHAYEVCRSHIVVWLAQSHSPDVLEALANSLAYIAFLRSGQRKKFETNKFPDYAKFDQASNRLLAEMTKESACVRHPAVRDACVKHLLSVAQKRVAGRVPSNAAAIACYAQDLIQVADPDCSTTRCHGARELCKKR